MTEDRFWLLGFSPRHDEKHLRIVVCSQDDGELRVFGNMTEATLWAMAMSNLDKDVTVAVAYELQDDHPVELNWQGFLGRPENEQIEVLATLVARCTIKEIAGPSGDIQALVSILTPRPLGMTPKDLN